ncbi:autotransporter outer membrane beta-barrel domain-containing protein [Azonexus sp.]|jgi:outer membrane autotransporter protein|uniref:autotransporter outer membrane beta-barrel domain-containing protein n=1 Tax=Azonexus sp. TaxID=1872668 RepID=UPI00282ED162|nr:autotransporter outer membrane beta-barrel domain-containing protein [Azonexus sp.]MDR1993976.1 autotransporter outer membrane beta-barrel domain-containing protein [Azonexus sp.]
MSKVLLSRVVYCFALFCIACALLAMPASPALAGQTINIGPGFNPGVDAHGNSLNGDGTDSNADPNNNVLNINSGGKVSNAFGADNVSWGQDKDVTGNKVFINNGGAVNQSVYGGRSTGSGNAMYNSVTISGGTVGGSVYSGQSKDGNAMYNSVTVSGGSVIGNVYGGLSLGSGNAMYNSVTISGGSVGLDVCGGFSDSGNATHNTVTITGSPSFNPDPVNGTWLTGGGAPNGDYFTGNTLNLWNYSGSPVRGVGNFQFFNFRIPSFQSGPVLTVTGVAAPIGGVSLGEVVGGVPTGRGSTVTAVNTNGNGTPPMPLGSSVVLIQANNLVLNGFNQGTTQGQHGATIRYLWGLSTTANELIATVASVGAAPEAKALSEGYLAGTMLVNQGADLIAGKGMQEAIRSSWKKDGGFGFGVFGAISGGWSKYDTGSHVDMSGLSLMTGLSFGANLAPGRLTVGAFFEYGTGSYDTYNSFATDVKGKGNLYHLGGGVLGRMDFVDTGPGNIYTEASFRMGGLNNEYRTSALRDIDGRSAKGYDSFVPYYGVHAGLGYIWKFTEQASLDLYGKFFWSRQQGDNVTLATGDPVKFKDVDSLRTRLGARFTYAVNDYIAPYIGAAWEHEFDGKARATTYGYDIDKPSLFGSTGIGELGLNLKPSKDLPLSFDLGVQGYVGKRQGITGSLQAKFEF